MTDPRVKTAFGYKEIIGTNEGVQYVTSLIQEIEQAIILGATTDYAAEDVLANAQGQAWTFENMGQSGQIRKALVEIQTTALTPRITLYLFRQSPTSTLTDNAANTAPSLADWSKYLGRIDFLAMEDLGGVSSSLVTPGTYGNLPLEYTGCSGKIYGISVTRDAITGETANDKMSIKLTREVFS